jgi:hypothetical protein
MTRCAKMVLLCLSLASCAFGQKDADQVTLGTFDFEGPSLAGWQGADGVAAVSADRPVLGKGCLLFDLNGKTGGRIFHGFVFPAAKEPRARMVRISFAVRSEKYSVGTVSISLLKTFDAGRESEWFDWDKPVFAAVPTRNEWTRFCAQGFVGPEVRSVNLYLNLNSLSKTGKVFIDDLKVELLDRGLRFNLGWKEFIFTQDVKTIDLIVSSPEKLKSGQVTLCNEEDRIVGRKEISRGESVVKVPLPTRGYYLASVRGEYDDGVKFQTSLPLAVVGPRIPDKERLQSRFGMSGDGEQFLDAGARWDRRRAGLEVKEYETAAKEGFKKPLPGPLYEVSEDRSSVYYLWPQPAWLQDRKDPAVPVNAFDIYPMKDWDTFRSLVAYAVKNLSKKPIKYVEVANEPECSLKGPWTMLVRYHQEMARGVKSVSPTTKVIGPCLCGIKIEELKVLHKLGLFDILDGLSIHAYVRSTPPEQEFIQLVRDLKSFMKSVGKEKMPIFFTEYGWPLPPGDWQKPVDPLTQARYCSRSLILLAAEEIDAIHWFCLRWADPSSGAYGYGLLNWEWTPRPSFPAYAAAVRSLTNTTGPGRILRVTPSGYLALFNRKGNTLAAVWDAEKTSELFLPKPWNQARDMMGRLVKEPVALTTEVTPSPLFVELAGLDFYHIKEIKSLQIRQGKDLLLPFTPLWTPRPLTMENHRLKVPADAPKGPYLLIGKVGTEWQAVTVNVIAPLEIVSSDLIWPMDKTYPELKVLVRSELARPVSVEAAIRLPGEKNPAKTLAELKPKTTSDCFLPLPPMEWAKRYRGSAVVTSVKTSPILRAQASLDLTVVPGFPMKDNAWDTLPEMDFSRWNSPDTAVPENDCSARLQVGYDDKGLHLRIAVRDDTHVQNSGPREMWNEDSVQIAFDMEVDQPWRPNVGGYNGHFKIFEYGAALGRTGPMIWRWISYLASLPGDVPEPRVRADITRSGDRTVYILLFPWATLGLNEPPRPGSVIGFSLAVNDFDRPAIGRKTLNLFHGIVDKKDPAAYGKIWFRFKK